MFTLTALLSTSTFYGMTPKWTTDDMPSQDGRTFVITGANSGIGLVAARELGRAGARVVLAVRDPARGEQAAATIDGETEVRRLDLADLASIRAFAEEWDGPIDALVDNAGVMATPQRRTKDGFELQIGTNHLGHFALTNLLLPHVTDRVVTVSSGAHRGGSIRLDDLNWERGRYSRWRAYGQSKLANLLFTLELQRRLAEAGSDVRAVAAHPGYARTNLQHHTESILHRGVMVLTDLTGTERGDGRAADAVRRDAGHPRRQLRRPGRLRGAARAPAARGPQQGGERRGDRAAPVGAVGGADGDELPAHPRGRVADRRPSSLRKP